ncbi:MAG: urease accessory UreF family protein [Bryobacterales bacterium]
MPGWRFAHSGGLETYSHVAGFTPEALEATLRTQIELGWGRLDMAAAALAYRAETARELDALGAEVEAWKPIPGQRLAGERIGRRIQILARRLYPAQMGELDVKPPQAPVLAGAVAKRLGLDERSFLLFYAQSNLQAGLAAATRSMSLSPERAHEILVSLQPRLAEQVEAVRGDPTASLWAATPALDARAHQQHFLHTRLFQS